MSDITEQAFKESEFYRKWAIAGMPADKQRLALAAWQAAQSVPGFVLVPVEPTSEMAEAGQDCIVGSRTSVDDVWQAMIEKAQEKKNG